MNIEHELRIGDAEREAAASALGEHFASGRLTREEYDERSERVWAAKTSSDLGPLFADLPSPHADQPAGSAGRAGRAAGSPDRDGGARPRRRWGPIPLVPVLALAVLLVALPGPPWPLFILGWLWVLGFFGRGWFGRGRWSHHGRC